MQFSYDAKPVFVDFYDGAPHFVHFAYKFTGKERDAESGLDYFGARYYGSSMGRFMSPDWADIPASVPYADLKNPQGLNLYAYVGNNPLRQVDPDGHDGEDDEEEAGCCDILPSKAEVDAVLAGIAAASEGAGGGGILAGAAPFLLGASLVAGPAMFFPKHLDCGCLTPEQQAAYAAKDKEDDEHTKNARPSTKEKHQKGRGRKKKDRGGEKGDKRRQQNGMFPRKPPGGNNPKGGWPPRDSNEFLPIPVPPPDKKKDKHGDG